MGCCSLRVEHVRLHGKVDGQEHVVELDFLGKDSIRYNNRVPVEKLVSFPFDPAHNGISVRAGPAVPCSVSCGCVIRHHSQGLNTSAHAHAHTCTHTYSHAHSYYKYFGLGDLTSGFGCQFLRSMGKTF